MEEQQKGWVGVKNTNKGWTEREKGQRVGVLRNNDIKMAEAWMIY